MKLYFWDGYNSKSKDTKNMENGQDEDIITIHLGKVLTQEQYDEVVASIAAFMNQRWPDYSGNRFSN